MANQKVTLSIDTDAYKRFKEFCEENDIMLSKRVERLMKKEMEEKGGVKE